MSTKKTDARKAKAKSHSKKSGPKKPAAKGKDKPKAPAAPPASEKEVHRSDVPSASAAVEAPGAVHRSDSSFNVNTKAPAGPAQQPSAPASDKAEPLTTFTPITEDTHRQG